MIDALIEVARACRTSEENLNSLGISSTITPVISEQGIDLRVCVKGAQKYETMTLLRYTEIPALVERRGAEYVIRQMIRKVVDWVVSHG